MQKEMLNANNITAYLINRRMAMEQAEQDRLNKELMDLTRFGTLAAYKKIIESGADVNHVDGRGYTPLREVVIDGDIEKCQCLLNSGADMHWRDKYDNTVLFYCSADGTPAMLELLLSVSDESLVKLRDGHGWTLLHAAAKDGSVDKCQQLIQKGINVDSVNKKGQTALHIAAYFCEIGVCELLINNGASIYMEDGDESTPLTIASKWKQLGGVFGAMDAKHEADELNKELGGGGGGKKSARL